MDLLSRSAALYRLQPVSRADDALSLYLLLAPAGANCPLVTAAGTGSVELGFHSEPYKQAPRLAPPLWERISRESGTS